MNENAYGGKTVLTGVKPTGTPHLGNLVGAIKPIIETAREAKSCYVFIADLHALNAVRDPGELRRNTYEVAATFLALGIDAEKAVLFRQSDIPEVYQFATLLNNVTAKGLMNRAHAYKAAVEANLARGADPDAGVNMGLYNYPILMAADIILYDTDIVPVGRDQKQHVEFARDIAGSFNAIYGEGVLKAPDVLIQDDAQAIPGLDGRKMSKSYNNYIPIFEERTALRKLVMKIITDSKLPHEPKDPESSTVFNIYRIFAGPGKTQDMREAFEKGGMGYGDAKKELFNVLDAWLEGPREKYRALMADTAQIDRILDEGAARARAVAQKTLARTSKHMLGRDVVRAR